MGSGGDLARRWHSQHPGFREAVLGDARMTARFRGERHEFRSRLDAVVQVLRLAWATDAFLALVYYRAQVACRRRGVPVVPKVLHRMAIRHASVNIGDQVVVRPGLCVPHGQIVLGGMTLVGEGVVLRPFVTLGLRDGRMRGPTLKPRVQVGTGAKIIGPVTVGAGARIGVNAVVLDDVPARAVVVGVPARVKRIRST